jgi:hypothetical protein
MELSERVYSLLVMADGKKSLKELLRDTDGAEVEKVVAEILDLWTQRRLILRPASSV